MIYDYPQRIGIARDLIYSALKRMEKAFMKAWGKTSEQIFNLFDKEAFFAKTLT
jgi:hypothetical protein